MVTFVDRNCWRGPRPADLKALRIDFGIDTMIDLEDGFYDMFHTIAQFPSDFGMAYYHMPCSDVLPPNQAYVDKCLDLMHNLDRHVYIHCAEGVDRTGFMVAIYRMRFQNWSYADALAEWKKMGRHPWYFYWEWALKKYAVKK